MSACCVASVSHHLNSLYVLRHVIIGYKHVFVSLNRYERKKNIFLAIDAARHLSDILSNNSSGGINNNSSPPQQGDRILLVVAGGYDVRVDENVEYLQVIRMP